MSSSGFETVYGRGLVSELRHVCHRPYLVVTMPDLWPLFADQFDEHMAAVHLVGSLEHEDLQAAVRALPHCNSVIGLGGGQALDVAKYVAWSRRIPLFQVPTALSVDAAWGHRIAVRFRGQVRYVGWAVPEAVYVDMDVIGGAPPLLNRSGIGDVLCFHTARADWQLAQARERTEARWPYDQALVDEAQCVLQTVLDGLDEIHDVTPAGIRILAGALRWGGAAYHNAGWNGRHIEGVEHFFFYALEYATGQKFIHGQPVCLGVYIGSALHGDQAPEMLAAVHRAGVDIRPQAMGVTWDQVAETLYGLRSFVEQNGLWYTVANEATIDRAFVDRIRAEVEGMFGPWEGGA